MPWGPGAVAAYVTHPSTPGRTSPSSAEVSVEEALGCDLEQFRMGLDVELEHGPGTRRPTSAGTIRSSPGRSHLPTWRSSRTTTPAWPPWGAKRKSTCDRRG